jgi:hypothetical protein
MTRIRFKGWLARTMGAISAGCHRHPSEQTAICVRNGTGRKYEGEPGNVRSGAEPGRAPHEVQTSGLTD